MSVVPYLLGGFWGDPHLSARRTRHCRSRRTHSVRAWIRYVRRQGEKTSRNPRNDSAFTRSPLVRARPKGPVREGKRIDMHTVVERELELKLVLSPERSIPVPARLSYRTDDPYAVHITFHVGSDHPVNWTFARELLVEGVFRACGHG